MWIMCADCHNLLRLCSRTCGSVLGKTVLVRQCMLSWHGFFSSICIKLDETDPLKIIFSDARRTGWWAQWQDFGCRVVQLCRLITTKFMLKFMVKNSKQAIFVNDTVVCDSPPDRSLFGRDSTYSADGAIRPDKLCTSKKRRQFDGTLSEF